MVLIEDNFAELFEEQIVEFNNNEFVVRSQVDKEESEYENYMFSYLNNNQKKSYNEKLICELFGQRN